MGSEADLPKHSRTQAQTDDQNRTSKTSTPTSEELCCGDRSARPLNVCPRLVELCRNSQGIKHKQTFLGETSETVSNKLGLSLGEPVSTAASWSCEVPELHDGGFTSARRSLAAWEQELIFQNSRRLKHKTQLNPTTLQTTSDKLFRGGRSARPLGVCSGLVELRGPELLDPRSPCRRRHVLLRESSPGKSGHSSSITLDGSVTN